MDYFLEFFDTVTHESRGRGARRYRTEDAAQQDADQHNEVSVDDYAVVATTRTAVSH